MKRLFLVLVLVSLMMVIFSVGVLGDEQPSSPYFPDGTGNAHDQESNPDGTAVTAWASGSTVTIYSTKNDPWSSTSIDLTSEFLDVEGVGYQDNPYPDPGSPWLIKHPLSVEAKDHDFDDRWVIKYEVTYNSITGEVSVVELGRGPWGNLPGETPTDVDGDYEDGFHVELISLDDGTGGRYVTTFFDSAGNDYTYEITKIAFGKDVLADTDVFVRWGLDLGATRYIYVGSASIAGPPRICRLLFNEGAVTFSVGPCVSPPFNPGAVWNGYNDCDFYGGYLYCAASSGPSESNSLYRYILNEDLGLVTVYSTSPVPPDTGFRQVAVDANGGTTFVVHAKTTQGGSTYDSDIYGYDMTTDLADTPLGPYHPADVPNGQRRNPPVSVSKLQGSLYIASSYALAYDVDTNEWFLDEYSEGGAPVPEFSTWALMLTLVIVITGFAVMKYKQRI